MIEQQKQWFIPSTTVVIHVGSGRKQVFHKKKFTIGYGSINTWNLDSENHTPVFWCSRKQSHP
jgi:hypothetical protein